MTSFRPDSQFVVIGGGIFGSSAALHLARLGARVTLVTDGAPANGASIAFSHSGATLGLIAGELLAREMATGEAHPLFAPFRPGRFAQ